MLLKYRRTAENQNYDVWVSYDPNYGLNRYRFFSYAPFANTGNGTACQTLAQAIDSANHIYETWVKPDRREPGKFFNLTPEEEGCRVLVQ